MSINRKPKLPKLAKRTMSKAGLATKRRKAAIKAGKAKRKKMGY